VPLVPPPVDDRTYDDLRAELIERIQVHTPEWTNHGPGDPGVTILELFAFLADSIIYRANRLPERARQQFLDLLRLPRRAATAAEGVVAFSYRPRGVPTPVHLEPDVEVLAGSVPFRTVTGLDVLPVDARPFVKARLDDGRAAEVRAEYSQLYAPLLAGADPAFYETVPVTFDPAGGPFDVANSVDGSLWLGLLAPPSSDVAETRAALGGATLTIGLVPPQDATPRVLTAGGRVAAGDDPGLIVHMPRAGEAPGSPDAVVYDRLDVRVLDDRSAGRPLSAHEPRLVEVRLPAADLLRTWIGLEPLEAGTGSLPPLLEGDDADRLVTWLRLRAGATEQDASALRLAWLGVNAAVVHQRAVVAQELLGRGTGAPDQTATLSRTPVIPGTVVLSVEGVPWTRVEPEGLAVAPGERADPDAARAFTVDRATGEVRFGDGLVGARPRSGQAIVASYAYGGGRAGLVPPGAIGRALDVPVGVTVTNPVATWGAEDAETVADAERRIPAHLRHRDRAVTADDVVDIVRAAPGVDLGRVEVLPLFHPGYPSMDVPGALTVLAVPRLDPVAPDAPSPDRFVLDRVCRHLEPRRLLTTEIHVRGPEYAPVWIAVGFEPVPGRDTATVRERLLDELRRWLSPLTGGPEGEGWPLGTAVSRLAAWAVAARVPGVAHPTEVFLTDASGLPLDEVPMTGLRLPRLIAVDARRGAASSLEQVRGGEPPEDEDGPPVLPVPVVPEDC
jgi:hypothetical protein